MLVQYGLLAVGILYTFFAALQWRAVGGTNKAAARALQLQQRPWVVPTGEIRTLPPEAYDSNEFRQWRFEIVLKNAGLSPALGIEVKGQNAISPARNPPPGPDDEFRPDQTFEFSVSMLGPGISNHIVGYAYEQFIERAREPGPSHKLWFWGIITYRDAFERTVTHTTRFCFRFVPGDGSYFEGPHNDCT